MLYLLLLALLIVVVLFLYLELKRRSRGLKLGHFKRHREKEERKRKALEFLKKHKRITNDQYQKLTGISDAQATRDLEELEREGKIKQVGKQGKYTFYTLKS